MTEVLIYSPDKGFTPQERALPPETPVVIRVNGQEWLTLLCTPRNLKELAVGLLYNEGVISGLDDLLMLRACDSETEIDACITGELPSPRRLTITSGCGRGVTYRDIRGGDFSLPPGPTLAPERVISLMKELQRKSELYRTAGGIHSSGIGTEDGLIWVAEDVGRHNTLDKLKGYCLLNEIPTEGKVILTTGRISSEMLYKAARMGVPIVASLTSPTDLAVRMAREWGITVIGYVRARGFRVYAGFERIRGSVGDAG